MVLRCSLNILFVHFTYGKTPPGKSLSVRYKNKSTVNNNYTATLMIVYLNSH